METTVENSAVEAAVAGMMGLRRAALRGAARVLGVPVPGEVVSGPVRSAVARPVDQARREVVSVRALLEWAFAVECASLDYDEVGAAAGGARAGVGSEYRIFQQLSLGLRQGEGVRPDVSGGRSYPHEDAEVVATILRNAVPFGLAVRVAELARACEAPVWDLGVPRLEPAVWGKRNHLGAHGRAELCREVSYVHRGRRRVRQEMWVPCVWVPSPARVSAARQGYLDWWAALAAVAAGLKGVRLARFRVSDRMPVREPWRKQG